MTAKTDLENPILALAAGDDEVWAWTNSYELVRVEGADPRITRRVDTRPGLLVDLAVGEGAVWGAGPCGLTPRAIATGYGSVWVLGARRVLRIDPRTRRMVGHPIAVGRAARDIAAGAGAIWVTTGERHGPTGPALCDLVGIDPASSQVIRRQPIGCPAAALAVGSGSVWAAGPRGRGIARVRPRGARLALPGVRLPGESVGVATGFGAVWVAGVRGIDEGPRGERLGRAVLSRLTADGRPDTRPLALGPAHAWLPRAAVGAGAVWVANTPTGTITRLDSSNGALSRVRLPVRR